MNGKKMLVALPCLIPSGGINVVIDLIEVLQKMGYHIDLLSREKGDLYERFCALGIEVRIEENILDDSLISWILKNYDEVFVNTLQMFGMIYKLNGKDIEVKWRLHEPPLFFSQYSEAVPQAFWDHLSDNVHVFAAGNVVHEHLLQTYGKENTVLNFGIPDLAGKVPDTANGIVSADKVTFLLPSVIFQHIKGQDILALAILNLPEEYQERTEFIFTGTKSEYAQDYYNAIKDMEREQENVKVLDLLEHTEMLALMKQADCIVAPSRNDATNACIVEGMMLSKLCISSDAAGIARYMQDCVNGFVFRNCDVGDLGARIMLVADNIERLGVVAANGRKVYEDIYSMETLEKNVRKYWGESQG